MKVRVIKPFRHGLRVFELGEVGETTTVEYPLTSQGKPVYDYYVRFSGYPPVGVRRNEVEEVTE